MTFKQAAVLAPVSFFLGILFICFNVDHKLLWGELTETVIADGFSFYTTFFNSPPAIKALLHGMIGVGVLGLVGKLHKWDDSAMFFDGSSLGVYVFAIAVYTAVICPTLKTVAIPLEEDTYSDRIEAVRVLAAANVIIMICLGLILTLQAGQVYAKRLEVQAIEVENKALDKEKKEQ
ncbi:Shr3 amino acid permease chaperone [Lentinula lateritia]|uniref:Shr3 amino acid permease chaperone n=2 Tax=Lentinula TaxID=5352 RepID=A0A9W9AZ84_9AGAR|nr:Shr3 amino acid permease chaperone [Lentinula aff. lateritia]KAJ3848357.1 Shr3 amino acid permease chaperone [Lentinula lateritia]KAJ3885515.1 Shr3 amino acid permease chaperone [Lentinula edodes]KAJ4492675.1 Shr3 amino acid permease chaperone [Lentinula edodes]KAJ4494233.1 Shr3 amino acid permease chaperone [Lentinula lateritia]